jgi:hypothetical protein
MRKGEWVMAYGAAVTPHATICTIKNETSAGLLLSHLVPDAVAGTPLYLSTVCYILKDWDNPELNSLLRANGCAALAVANKESKGPLFGFLLDMSPPKDYNFSRVIHIQSV